MKIKQLKGMPKAARRNALRMASLFLIFALLSSLFYIPCYLYIRTITRRNAVEYYQQKLEDGLRSLDTSLTALSNLQILLNGDERYRAISYLNADTDPAVLSALRSIVSTYLVPYDAVADAGVSQGDDLLFTRRRIYYKRDALRQHLFFSCEGLSVEAYLQQFQEARCILPVQQFYSADYGHYEAFTVAWRWSTIHDIYFFATFPVKTVLSLMAEEGVLSSGRITITQGDTLIAAGGQAPQEAHEVVTAASDAMDLQVSVAIPGSYIDQDLDKLHALVNVFLAVALFATAVWVIVCAMAAVRPLNRAVAALLSSKHLSAEGTGRAAAANLAEGIRGLDTRLSNYEDIIAAQAENLRVHTLERALYRGLYDEEARRAFCASYPQFPARWQLALGQYAPQEDVEADAMQVTLLFTECLQRELPQAILLPIDGDTLLLILPYGVADQALATLREDMRLRYGMLFSFVVGEPYEDPASLSEAYQQLEYESSLSMGAGAVVRREKPPLSLQQLQSMYMALSGGDAKAALILLEDCARPLLTVDDYFLTEYTHRLLASMLVMIKLETTCDLSDIPVPSFKKGQAAKLLQRDLPRCFEDIAQRIALQRKEMSRDFDESVLAFIDANLGNPLLCINMVTEEFHISAPTLQKRLHAAAGKTFSSYVEDARMDKARQMLRETDLTVQEISESCGYAAPNSFHKAYKRRFAETPLAMRKQP